jgi:hypothetical protein
MLACAKTDPLHKDNASAAACAPFQVRAMYCLLLRFSVTFGSSRTSRAGRNRIGRRLSADNQATEKNIVRAEGEHGTSIAKRSAFVIALLKVVSGSSESA